MPNACRAILGDRVNAGMEVILAIDSGEPQAVQFARMGTVGIRLGEPV